MADLLQIKSQLVVGAQYLFSTKAAKHMNKKKQKRNIQKQRRRKCNCVYFAVKVIYAVVVFFILLFSLFVLHLRACGGASMRSIGTAAQPQFFVPHCSLSCQLMQEA